MAIAFRAAANASSLSTGSLTVDVPAGTQDEDVMIAVITVRTGNNVDNAITAPGGGTWTLVQSAYDPGSPGVRTNVYRRVADDDEPDDYTWTFANNNEPCGSILSYSGVDPDNPIHTEDAGVQDTGSATRTTPSIDVDASGCWIISWFADRSGSTWDGPDTERSEIAVPATSSSQVVCDSAGTVSTGSTSRTATASASTSVAEQGIIALAPLDTGAKTGSDSADLTETAAVTAAADLSDTATLTESALVTVLGVPLFTFAIDWGADGAFDGPNDNVTDDVLASGGFSADFGRDQARALSPPASGRAAWQLNNLSRDYSPENPESPLAGDLLPARPVLSTIALDGEVHTLFRGFEDDFKVNVERNSYTVECTALDPLAMLRGSKISTQLHKGIRTGEAIELILDAAGWPEELRQIDPGATTIRWWWEEDTDAYEALIRVMNSEGPPAIVHADPGGRVVFRDRHHRELSAASTSSQATITDGEDGFEPAFSGFTYDHGWKEIINHVTISVEERDPSLDPETVWESADVRLIAASATVEIAVQTNEPVIEPVLTFTTLTGAVSGTIVQESGQRLTIELTAGGAAASVSGLVVTGRAVAVRRTYQVTQEDTASQATFGMRSQPYEAPWAGANDGQAIADIVVAARAERVPVVEIRIVGVGNPTRLTEQISRDLSDRVHITEGHTGLDADCFVEQIKHRMSGGQVLETTFGLERAADPIDNLFIFDMEGHGFDDGVFGA